MNASGRRTALSAAAMVAIALTASCLASEGAVHWGYAGAQGAARWGNLSKEFATGTIGKTQSPIDIRDKDVKSADLDPIRFDYKPSPLRI